MSFPVRHLPVLQNWDCHVCGNCCKEYVVSLSEAEHQRIEAQGWRNDPVIGDLPLFIKTGPWWRRRYALNHREDGSCLFLSEEGRCRIHERFGYETKPLPCRMFPFVLVPAGDHWRVGMRFACPSAAGNLGRPVSAHESTLKQFATELAEREGLARDGAQPPPRLQGRQRLAWGDVQRLVRVLVTVIQPSADPLERRLRKCLALAKLCRQARFDQVSGNRLQEFLQIVTSALDAEVQANPAAVPAPGWVGRILFRQAVAVFTRKDRGPDRGIAREGRLALLQAAWRFALGKGEVPRLHNKMEAVTFEAVEAASSTLPPDAQELLERYYTTKLQSMQFFGATNFNIPFWDGLEMLLLTFPILMWVTRALPSLPRKAALERALTIVDDHFGYNPVLRSRRQRVSFQLLARSGELGKLIAWYGR